MKLMIPERTIGTCRDVWSDMYMYIVRMSLTNDFIIAVPFGRAEVYTWRFTGVELPIGSHLKLSV